MASKELQDRVKKKLFEQWLPEKPGGLKGLINMAADAALEVVGKVELYQEEIDSLGDLSSVLGPVAQEQLVNLDQKITVWVHTNSKDTIQGMRDWLFMFRKECGIEQPSTLSLAITNSEPDDASNDAAERCQSTSNGFDCVGSTAHDGKHTSEGDADGIRYEWTDDGADVRIPPLVDQTQYRCPQCHVMHQRDSGVGARHAHLFYGDQPAVVHLEHCPVLKDPEAVCNCNAVQPSGAQRAQDRRDPHG